MRTLSICLLALETTACTGMTLGENRPGGDTSLDPSPQAGHQLGALAVEPDEDRVWLVHSVTDGRGGERAQLAAVDPDTGISVDVLDVADLEDRRIVFPRDDRALLLGERAGHEELTLLDTDRLSVLRSTRKAARYQGTRLSPTGRWLVVADNQVTPPPLHVIDTDSLQHVVLPQAGESLEAMWAAHTDALYVLAVTSPFGAAPVAHIRRYRAPYREADLDLELPGYGWDFFFSFTWIGVSPDDRYVVFPVIERARDAHVLLVLDQRDGSLRTVAGRGPVGFTPDGSTIVSYRYDEDGRGVLELISVDTLAVDHVELPLDPGGLSFFVTWDGNFVVARTILSAGKLVVYDPETGEATQVEGPSVPLDEFVTRPGAHELWLVSLGSLYRLGLDAPALDEVSTGGVVRHINILPARDRLVLGEDADVVFFDPEALAPARIAHLPLP